MHVRQHSSKFPLLSEYEVVVRVYAQGELDLVDVESSWDAQ
jgi:hypothetical protein